MGRTFQPSFARSRATPPRADRPAFVAESAQAKPADYRKAVQRLYHPPDQTSFIELPMVETK
jgi:hypothetical protein